jgi:hypothetical protein
VAIPEQATTEMPADEACAAGDKNVHGQTRCDLQVYREQ